MTNMRYGYCEAPPHVVHTLTPLQSILWVPKACPRPEPRWPGAGGRSVVPDLLCELLRLIEKYLILKRLHCIVTLKISKLL